MNAKDLKIPVIILIAAISVGHVITPVKDLSLHNLLRHFYIVPIVICGLYFGLRGGLTASLAVSILFVPHFKLQAPLSYHTGNVVQIMLFFLSGYLAGSFTDSSKKKFNDAKICRNRPVELGEGFLYWVDDSQLALNSARWVSDYINRIEASRITLLWIREIAKPDPASAGQSPGRSSCDFDEEASGRLNKVKAKLVLKGFPESEIHQKIITCHPKSGAVDCVLKELHNGRYTGIFAMKHFASKMHEFLFGDPAMDLVRRSQVPVILFKSCVSDD